LACSVWFGFGDAAEGDFEAEGAEFADVVGDLAADVALALVVVDPEVLVAHAGVGQQIRASLEDIRSTLERNFSVKDIMLIFDSNCFKADELP